MPEVPKAQGLTPSVCSQYFMKIPPEETRSEWRKIANNSIITVLGDYTPEEFIVLLDAVDLLERENAELKASIHAAIEYANGRESEWGDRAEGAFAYLYRALANSD